jgi:hypothetical protein
MPRSLKSISSQTPHRPVSCTTYVLRPPPISLFLTWEPKYFLGSADRGATSCAVFFVLLLFRPSQTQFLILKHTQPMSLAECERPSFTPILKKQANLLSCTF